MTIPSFQNFFETELDTLPYTYNTYITNNEKYGKLIFKAVEYRSLI